MHSEHSEHSNNKPQTLLFAPSSSSPTLKMYKIVSIIVAIAALSGSAAAFSDTCTPGQFYCGSQLLNGSGASTFKT